MNDIERENALDRSLSGQSQHDRLIDSVSAVLCGNAYDLKLSHTVNGEWTEDEQAAKAERDMLLAMAGDLRNLKDSARSQGDAEPVLFVKASDWYWIEQGGRVPCFAERRDLTDVPLYYTQPPSGVPEWMQAISENLHTQDNRITADPLFVVFQKTPIVVDEDYDHDRIMWVDDEGHEADEVTEDQLNAMRSNMDSTCFMEDEIELGDDEREEWRRHAIKEVDQFVTACFTEAGAEAYLNINGHNLNRPFIYVTSLFRNEEMKQLRNWLLSTNATPPRPQENPVVPKDVAQAHGMYMVGYSWLKHNAPDEIHARVIDAVAGEPVESMDDAFKEAWKNGLSLESAEAQWAHVGWSVAKEAKAHNTAGCHDCGLEYGGPAWIEAIVPDKVWNSIRPDGLAPGCGILCISCIAKRLSAKGLDHKTAVPVWLCGTEPLRAVEGDPGDPIDVLRGYTPPRPEWVKCSDRLPTEDDADLFGNVWCAGKWGSEEVGVGPITWRKVGNGAAGDTHWMPTGLKRPNPPEQGGE